MIPGITYDPDRPSIRSDPWKPVVYDPTKQAEIVQQVFESFRLNYAVRQSSKMVMPIQGEELLDLIKDDGFRDEVEFRVRLKVHNPRWKFVKHRASPLGVVPYVELTSPDVPGRPHAVKASYLPIGAIRVGPTRFAEQARMSVVELLYQHGYRDVEVCVSRIPFR